LNYLGGRVDPAKVIVTHLAASALFYPNKHAEFKCQVKEKYEIPPGMPYLLSLCTMEPRKNIEQVIKAFVEICNVKGITDLQLVLVGARSWRFEKIFETFAYAKEFHDRIIITCYINDEHPSAIYSDALAFVYPSFYEGFGLPPLEAMQCGVPVITSNTSSLPEVIGDAGIMVGPKDNDALCQAILSIYKSQTLRDKMSLAGIDRAREFSWKK
jgi:glycosyltransferase involved in cell wall biosynthesis